MAHFVNLGAAAVDADAAYLVVDLSDTTNFPHKTGVEQIILKAAWLNAEVAGDGAFRVKLGVVTEVDATDGSVTWLHVWNLETHENATDGSRQVVDGVDFTLFGQEAGLPLRVVSGALVGAAGNQADSGSFVWQTDVALTSPVGSAAPAAGDLVLLVDETAGTGTITFSLSVVYDTI